MIDNKPELLQTVHNKLTEIFPIKYFPRGARNTTFALIAMFAIAGCRDNQVLPCERTDAMFVSQAGEEAYNAGFRVSGDLTQPRAWDANYRRHEFFLAYRRAACKEDTQIIINGHVDSYLRVFHELQRKGYDGAMDTISVEDAARQYNIK